MTQKQLIPFADGITVEVHASNDAEFASRSAAINDAMQQIKEAITKANIKATTGYAGIANADEAITSARAAIDDIKMPDGQKIQRLFLYIEISGAMTMDKLAELNNAAKALFPDGVEPSIYIQPTPSGKERKIVAIAF
ncbi:MAG: hypothetical protein K6F33_13615 [Bacteroidales bacterium]|nr:hypothetical protein [Bacteroidales bacterium]